MTSFSMSYRAIAFVLGTLVAMLGLAMWVPLGVAYFSPIGAARSAELTAFMVTSGGAIIMGALAHFRFRDSVKELHAREGFAIVTFSWLLLSVVGMLPYLLSGVTSSVTDAFFETMSGFTTTGASIFPSMEVIPPGIMLWRCMTQWLGGMGVVMLGVALLPMLGVGGYKLLKAETPGGVVYERDRPRITDAATELWALYLGLSLLLTLLLWGLGMSLYDAVCHSFTTMSTGGFSTHTASMGFFPSPYIQWTVIFFMLLAGMNFSLHAQVLRGQWRAFKDVEARSFLLMLGIATVIGVGALSAASDKPIDESMLRDVAFSVVSVTTTTGFGTADFNLWPQLVRLILVLLMFVGGCMGSTAGGIKVTRIIIYGKSLSRELHRMVFPHAVRSVRVGDRVIDPAVVVNILTFGTLFMISFLIGALTMAAAGYDLVTSLSASVAALGNIGPGLGRVGPAANWAHLPDYAKWVMSGLMLLGRLELFSVVILLTRWAWQR